MFGSWILIILSMPFISKRIEDTDSVDLRDHSHGILLLLIKGDDCLEK